MMISKLLALALLAPPMMALAAADAASKLDLHRIREVTGGKGDFDEKEGVFKVSLPRKDLEVSVAGARLTPPMGLTSWAAFKPAGEQTMVMGDMVLVEDQVSPVMDAALRNGLEVTGLHNHFVWETPKVMFLHVGGLGEEQKLARAVGEVFKAIRETSGGKGEVPKARIDPAETTLDPKKIEAILGVKGKLKEGVYKVVVGREATMHGHAVAGAMGVNTWAAFAGSDGEAVVGGDFAMLAEEVQPVLKALRAADIHVVALHNHMVAEMPPYLFLHYWGVDSTEKLARGLRTALDLTREREAGNAAPARIALDFDNAPGGALRDGLRTDVTGKGAPSEWSVVEDPTAPSGANVLAQTSSDPTSARFPLCVYDGLRARDVAVSVKIRPLSGKVDQAGGIVWRYLDRENYYVVRANALEDNVVLYKVEKGKRTDLKPAGASFLAYGKKVEVPAGEWSELRVVARGRKHSVHFDGAHLFDVEDDAFYGPGRVGLWTKADSVTRFDDLVIEKLDGGSDSRRP